MKIFGSVLLAAVAVAAQKANIAVPINGTDVQAGSNITIEVDRPNFLSSANEVAIVLGLVSCSDNSTCRAPQEGGGINEILYQGPFNPQYGGYYALPPHQNFTVTVPADFANGTAQLSLTQFTLIGASLTPTLFYDVVHVNVVDAEAGSCARNVS
ncbi:hypothetical protein V5O48_016509 [Marasmius crinis-equi]|uniref:Uncharacterized protein n=1 Tax=Marasmius crinis-equi TaxID=585013 RepID=A0ABR3ERP0_9AGAR